ncbi:MAG: NADH-quinone oxidoreductase subunit M [Gammaproteobacteria bacterium]|jgi:NADH-quinone oxidoreductase subunit M|nr:NADH-quinone oxidoreductase subunit M [Gammaproteobacteria bacterium]MBP6051503.1 NADH-quinone oxidoreductase subunit M [Pseudomonadales bacterium]MBK7167920.1 NADH-quinone oxidoreductase subunit M [Gammaproteobacteria bacterium]MBK7518778.1 NADH-quinone oxidoreductase subunit M [Gammaproteobacteria bacterium]MBK7730476.1 NADH-quinone oxidoreductase subunit M [Gammaproteobacteria bacterium]
MLLAWLILIPLIGGLLCWQSDRFGNLPRWIALLTMLTVFALSLWLWSVGDYSLARGIHDAPQWQMQFRQAWIPHLGISLHLGVDGLSLALVILTGFIGILSILCSWREIQRSTGFFHLNLLWILGGVIGVFLALDLFLFFLFWEMMLVPMYFLIALWGHRASSGKSRISAATKFFIYTQASGLVMLLSILGLAFAHADITGVLSFDYEVLRGTSLAPGFEFLLMLGFFVAFAVKLPVVPLHGWLPDAHSQAPTAGSVDLAGLLLKTAAYGLLRFALPLFPESSASFAPVAMWLGLGGIFYGAFQAFAQTDIKRMVAYTSISHMGYVLIGIYAGSAMALQGTVVQMIAHGLSASALFILCGQLYERLHTRDMRQMGGLWARLPWLPAMAMFFAAASLGLPGTGNFIGEFLILAGSYTAAPLVVALATGGLVFASAYSLALVHRSMFGPARSDAPVTGPSLRELAMLLSLVGGIIALGIYPQPVLDMASDPVARAQQIHVPPASQTHASVPR